MFRVDLLTNRGAWKQPDPWTGREWCLRWAGHEQSRKARGFAGGSGLGTVPTKKPGKEGGMEEAKGGTKRTGAGLEFGC